MNERSYFFGLDVTIVITEMFVANCVNHSTGDMTCNISLWIMQGIATVRLYKIKEYPVPEMHNTVISKETSLINEGNINQSK